jgi:hypothetical protein
MSPPATAFAHFKFPPIHAESESRMFPIRQERISVIMRLVHDGEAAAAGALQVREEEPAVIQ